MSRPSENAMMGEVLERDLYRTYTAMLVPGLDLHVQLGQDLHVFQIHVSSNDFLGKNKWKKILMKYMGQTGEACMRNQGSLSVT
jgi:hypothetical protein